MNYRLGLLVVAHCDCQIYVSGEARLRTSAHRKSTHQGVLHA